MKYFFFFFFFFFISSNIYSQDYCYSKIGQSGKEKENFEPTIECLNLYLGKSVFFLEKNLPKYRVINVSKLCQKEYEILYHFDNIYTSLRIQVSDSINGAIKFITLSFISYKQYINLSKEGIEKGYKTKDNIVFKSEQNTFYLSESSEYSYGVTFYKSKN